MTADSLMMTTGLGEGKWGRTKYRRIPESGGDRKGPTRKPRHAGTGKSTLWTNAGQDRNFQRTLISNSLMGSFGKGSLQKIFRNFPRYFRNFPQNFRTLS